MKRRKPQIGWDGSKFIRTTFRGAGAFTIRTLSDKQARQMWDSPGRSDWTQGAYQEMARRVMS